MVCKSGRVGAEMEEVRLGLCGSSGMGWVGVGEW